MIKGFQRNIKLLYWLSFLHNLFFWLGTWALFYLLFTNYAGVGLIETAMIISMIVFEIPSGVLADLWGRKNTLVIAFLIVAFSEFFEAGAINLSMLLLAAIGGSLGSALISGTFESITYDSLKKLQQEKIYNKVLARQRSLKYLAMALATILGGFTYTHLGPRIPFFLTGIMNLLAMVVALFLKEPKIIKKQIKKVSSAWKTFWNHFLEGSQYLFKSTELKSVIILLLLAGIIPLIMYEMVADLTIVAYGATAIQLSWIVFIVLGISGLTVHFAKTLTNLFGDLKIFIGLSLFYAILVAILAFVNLGGAIIVMILLTSLGGISEVVVSTIINRQIYSQHRTTALSTFNMLVSLPYVFSAFGLGILIDKYTIRPVVFGLGVIMLIGLLMGIINLWKKRFVINR